MPEEAPKKAASISPMEAAKRLKRVVVGLHKGDFPTSYGREVKGWPKEAIPSLRSSLKALIDLHETAAMRRLFAISPQEFRARRGNTGTSDTPGMAIEEKNGYAAITIETTSRHGEKFREKVLELARFYANKIASDRLHVSEIDNGSHISFVFRKKTNGMTPRVTSVF